MDKDVLRRDRQALVDELTQAGAKFKGNYCTCPYHDDRRASSGVYCKDNIWRFKCQVCDAAGDYFDIKAKNEGKTAADVLRECLGRGQKASERTYFAKGSGFADLEAVRSYLRSKVGTIELEHPYRDAADKETLMTVFRCRPPDEPKTYRPCYPVNDRFVLGAPPTPRPLYNLPGIADADTVVVVEGEKCVDALTKHAIAATTSPCGAGNAAHAHWEPLGGKNIILWPDNHDEGRDYIAEAERQLQTLDPQTRISILDPASLDLGPKEDAFDFIEQVKAVGTKNISGALHDALNKSKPRSIASGIAERMESVIAGIICAIAWPWASLARLTKALLPGTVTLLCGSPGASKSFMLLQALAFWLAIGVKASVFMLEEDGKYHVTRALAQQAGIAGLTDDEWVRDHAEETRQALTEHADFLNTFGRCVHASPETQPTLEQLAAWVRERAKAGDRVIAIDPITGARRTGDPWVVDNTFLSEVKHVAVDHGCSIVMVTHPTKGMASPDMNQLAGSAAYARFAQAIVWLESHDDKESLVRTDVGRTELSHNRTLHILKARNGRGMGLKLAYQFESEGLTLKEFGLILKD